MHKMLRLFEFSKDLMCVASTDGFFLEVNPAFQRVLGYSQAELTEVPFIELVHHADREKTLAEIENLAKGKEVLRFENRYRCKDGSYKWLSWVSTPEVDENLIYAVARDITDSKQSLDALMSDLPGMIYRCVNDANFTMNFVSSGCYEITGYTAEDFVDLKTVTYDSLIHPDDREEVHLEIQSAVNDHREFQLEYRIITPERGERIVSERGRAVHNGSQSATLQGCIFDVTEHRKLAVEVNQLQKMEALGQLTGGVAHDFNNLLTVVIGNLELLEAVVKKDSEAVELVTDALESAWRGADLCGRLLAFGRRQILQPEPTDINALIDRVQHLVKRTIGDNVDVDVSLRNDLPEITIDQGQMENAILNLTINARDAMPEGGKLCISTSPFHASTAYTGVHPDVVAGNYVQIEVSDTGIGMPAAVRDRVFEPFFTTKEKGKGTGLGLSMVYGLLKQSGGHVRIYSEVGHGTSVKLFVPAAKHSADPLAETAPLASEGAVPGGTERILVVEDDLSVKKVVVKALSEMGYSTIEMNSGAGALEYLKSNCKKVDLLFTDVIMPGGIDGVRLADQAIKLNQDLKVLLTSGFSSHHFAEKGPYAFLSKPYHKQELAAAIRRLLDS